MFETEIELFEKKLSEKDFKESTVQTLRVAAICAHQDPITQDILNASVAVITKFLMTQESININFLSNKQYAGNLIIP